MSDETRRKALIEKIKKRGGIRVKWEQAPLVSLEDFFIGNEDEGSIGTNLVPHPGLSTFFETLKSVRERDDVQDLLVAVTDMEEESEGIWPFSDVIYMLTSASTTMVEQWLEPLQPDEALEVTDDRIPENLPAPHPSYRVLLAWWD